LPVDRFLPTGRLQHRCGDQAAPASEAPFAFLFGSSETGEEITGRLGENFTGARKTAAQPISRVMQRLLTGHALVFNRTHGRCGHLFQNRFKSVLVDDDTYLQAVIRYIHLNPLRAGAVADLAALARYPWSGHAGMLGVSPRPWHATADALAAFGSDPSAARRAYVQFVCETVPGVLEQSESAGWVESDGEWKLTDPLRRGREAWVRGERVLGSVRFVHATRERLPAASRPTRPRHEGEAACRSVQEAAALFGLTAAELRGASQRPAVVRARTAIAVLLVRECGWSLTEVASRLGTSRWSVRRALERSRHTGVDVDERLDGLIAQLAGSRAR
jgi:hypothetical protein